MKMRRYWIYGCIPIVLFLAIVPVYANVRLPKIFASNMVLQQNTEVNIWGWADPDEIVTVTGSWNNESVSVTTDALGSWRVKLETPVATTDGSSYTLTIQGNNKRTLTGVLIGEVWLLSGQSNIELPLNGWPDSGAIVEGSGEAIINANYPNIRFIIIGRKSASEPQNDFVSHWTNATWTACSPNSARWFSAVGYFFGVDVYETLNIPVGLILSAWGGSSCEAWTSAEALEDVLDFHGQEPWSSTDSEDNLTPTTLYNGMIAPLIPFTMAGVLWYQGETNVGRAEQLTELFPAMIKGWRKDWDLGDFLFYFVQLAPWGGNGGYSLPEFWEAQATALSLSNTGMVVTLDLGDEDNIHPPKKEPVGQRLALWAKAGCYGQTELVYSGPIYKSIQIENDKIRILFDHAETGLKSASEPLEQFEIAGDNGLYYPASAQIDGQDVLVSSSQVPEPKHVRYAWSGTATASLYNNADLPAAAFRTDRPDYLTSVKSSFKADPRIIKQGDSSTLSWLTTGAAEVRLNDAPVSTSGSVNVEPDTNTLYTLTAVGETTLEKNMTIHVVSNDLTNWSAYQQVTSSSTEGPDRETVLAVDNNTATRWSSEYSDSQWICIDFGESIPVERVLLYWETAFGKVYEIQVSEDQTDWTTIFTETDGDGDIDDLMNLSGSGRYIRLYGIERGTQWGFSLWEFLVFSSAHRTGIEENREAPVKFGLIGNYPNPFNPDTNIQFRLKKSGHVELNVYDLTGRLVKSLFCGSGSAGRHELCWTAAGLPSGPYFMCLTTDEFLETRKVILLK